MYQTQRAQFRTSDVKRYLRDLLNYTHYAFPNIVQPAPPLSARGRELLRTFRADGIVMINDPKLVRVAEHLETVYFRRLETLDRNGRQDVNLTTGHHVGAFEDRQHSVKNLGAFPAFIQRTPRNLPD